MNVPRSSRGSPSLRRKPKPRHQSPASTGKMDGGVHPVPAPFSLESAYGSVQPSGKPEDFDAVSRTAKDAKGGETARMG